MNLRRFCVCKNHTDRAYAILTLKLLPPTNQFDIVEGRRSGQKNMYKVVYAFFKNFVASFKNTVEVKAA